MGRPLAMVLLVAMGVACGAGCKERYRVGDYVLVDWCDDKYPAYVVARKGPARYRVHFDGYAERWDTDVGLEEIRHRLEEAPETSPPLCDHVARAMGVKSEKESKEATPYEEGAKITVTWRGSTYKATIIEVIDRDHYRIHYDGHESAWDEVITQDRIVKGQ